MPVDFNRLIENHLQRDSRPKKVGSYYPSEAGYCLRKSWYSYRHPVATDPVKAKHFHLGNMLHDFIAEVIEDPKNSEVQLLEKEVSLKINMPEFVISGRLDDVFMLTADGRKFLLEVKSTNSWLDKMVAPQDAHLMQIQLYMHAHEVKEGIVLYVDKGSLESKWFRVAYDPAYAEKTIARIAELDYSLKNGTLPPSEARNGPMSWMCKGCEYAEKCAGEK